MMTSAQQQIGLGFKKLDLHIHTPKSNCFKGTCTPDEVVEAAIEKGLAGIAVTDHNSAEWVDEVIDAAKGRPLIVFPGVEVTCTGGKKSIHIIGLFDVDKRAEAVKVLLNVLGITSEALGANLDVTVVPVEATDAYAAQRSPKPLLATQSHAAAGT